MWEEGELYNNNINKNTKKLEIITFYNSTKSGTDIFDQFGSLYSVSRKTKRWPMRFFFLACLIMPKSMP